MKVLLIGGGGQLGAAIRGRWTRDSIFAPSSAELNLTDAASLERAVTSIAPEVVINCAAFHNVDVCEREAYRALEVNALAVDGLAGICERFGIGFMTISTDYVFDGAATRPYCEDDCARPISAYGVSKLAGELLVLRRAANTFVVRTCGVYGLNASRSKGTFIDRVINQARGGETIRVVNDVIVSPTYAGHLAEALRKLVETQSYGLYHACNVGAVSWYDYAAKALELAGIDHPIEPISSSEWKAAARRPAFSALANGRLERLGIEMPSWEAGIAAYLRDKAS